MAQQGKKTIQPVLKTRSKVLHLSSTVGLPLLTSQMQLFLLNFPNHVLNLVTPSSD